MKLGEIKIEALKLMFAGDGLNVSVSELSDLITDENYKFYLSAMPGSINRAFSIFEEKGLLKSKFVTLSKSQGEVDGDILKFNLSTLITDYFSLCRTSLKQNCLSGIELDYKIIDDYLELENNFDGEILVEYKPKLTRISATTSDETEMPIDSFLCEAIPYFIKSELFVEDEPSLAENARELFDGLINSRIEKQQFLSVLTKYSQTEL